MDKAWFETFFDEDYLEIYVDVLLPEVTAGQVDGIEKLLDLQPGARILDLACGHGRHAIALAERGYDVTGFDLSATFLKRAREDAAIRGTQVRWMQGDMRELDFESEFDAVINVFTAFGYFEDESDDTKTLDRVRASLRPEGLFLIETLFRDGLPARFTPKSYDKTSRGRLVLHDHNWDLEKDVIEDQVTLINPDGTKKEYRTSVRMRTLREYLALMRSSGLEPETWYGGLNGVQLDFSCRRLVLLSRRPT